MICLNLTDSSFISYLRSQLLQNLATCLNLTDMILPWSLWKYWELRRTFCPCYFLSLLLCILPYFSVPCHLRLLCFDYFSWLSSHLAIKISTGNWDCNDRPITNKHFYYFSKAALHNVNIHETNSFFCYKAFLKNLHFAISPEAIATVRLEYEATCWSVLWGLCHCILLFCLSLLIFSCLSSRIRENFLFCANYNIFKSTGVGTC